MEIANTVLESTPENSKRTVLYAVLKTRALRLQEAEAAFAAAENAADACREAIGGEGRPVTLDRRRLPLTGTLSL